MQICYLPLKKKHKNFVMKEIMKTDLSVRFVRTEIFAGRKILFLSINKKVYGYEPLKDELSWLLKKLWEQKKYGDGKALNFIKKRTKMIFKEA